MLVNWELYSLRSARVVASVLYWMLKHPEDERPLPIELERFTQGFESVVETVYVRPVDGRAHPTVLADEQSIMFHCVTDAGKRIDFIIGKHFTERALDRALVIYEE